jgi:hypothetical protein
VAGGVRPKGCQKSITLKMDGTIMRAPALAAICLVCMTGAALAQQQDRSSVPHEIGNRANGFNYQPSPGEVVGREERVGVRPSRAQLEKMDQTLESIDFSLLRDEGLSERSVPAFKPSLQ